MKNAIRNSSCCITVLAILVLVMPGCTQGKDGKKNASTTSTTSTAVAKDDHEHGEHGPHGGLLAEWVDYHAEFTVDPAAKQAVVYILDDKAKKAPKIAPDKITDVKLVLKNPKLEMDLKYDAKRSGTDNIVFVGSNDAFAKTGDFAGALSAKINDKPHTGTFPEGK